jgi:hypothetical protein
MVDVGDDREVADQIGVGHGALDSIAFCTAKGLYGEFAELLGFQANCDRGGRLFRARSDARRPDYGRSRALGIFWMGRSDRAHQHQNQYDRQGNSKQPENDGHNDLHVCRLENACLALEVPHLTHL